MNLNSAYTPVHSLDAFSEAYLVMPHYKYTLNGLIQSDRVQFSHHNVRYLIYQALCGLKHLVDIGIVHKVLF
jgi:hypothetical protein